MDEPWRTPGRTMTLEEADALAAKIVAALEPVCARVAVCGSVRRRCQEVHDLDVLVIGSWMAARDALRASGAWPVNPGFDAKEKVQWLQFRLDGAKVDVMFSAPEEWGAGLCHLTGSKRQNIKMRSRAIRMSLKLSQHGVFTRDGARIAGATEEDVYGALRLPFVPPEGRG